MAILFRMLQLISIMSFITGYVKLTSLGAKLAISKCINIVQ